ncbi:DUF11 domain-containing protein [Janthinobacterium sp. CG3]|uniref:DUF11 domain-containing protein n=1 Tax=Janthinobacterium sp. CG3 TaxID=1075768 RepID=UPI0004756F7D|nr:DUF11 domain-containing protein [Janthinobacterium sp. CG3]
MSSFRPPRRRAAAALLLAAALACAAARAADTPITLFKSFAGNVNFTGAQKTLRTKSNASGPCDVTTSATLTLNGIPTGAVVLNAQLYWAGSGSTPDYSVLLDGVAVAAPGNRQFSSATVGYDYFSGAADVTSQVNAKKNNTYLLSGLSFNNGAPHCAVEGVLGGFQLLVIYSKAGETFRVLNLYEGFQYIRNSSLSLNLSNFQIPNPLGSATGRVGHITWEGDTTLSGGGEDLRYNGVGQVDASNVSGNQFNSASNINADAASYGIDFDAYTVQSPVILSGQTSASTAYSSGADLVLLNAEIIAAPNVPATDRSIAMVLDGPLAQSKTSKYTITLGNNGPLSESGPITVTDTLPAAFIVGGAGGSGWSCTVAGQLVSCSNPGPLAVGATLAPLVVTVTAAANASGSITNSASVGGALFDYYDGNNTASVSAIVGAAQFVPAYMLTDALCVHNVPFGNAGQPCKPVTLTSSIANVDIAGLYITYVSAGVPTALGSGATNVPMRFALSCHDPVANAGKQASFTSVGTASNKMPLCVGAGAMPGPTSGAWSAAVNVSFPGNSPTVGTATTSGGTTTITGLNNKLLYPDVGRIEMYMSDAGNRLGSTGAFVSKPQTFLLTASTLGLGANQATTPALASNPAFVAAGAAFKLGWSAMTGGVTPVLASSFGREQIPARIKLKVEAATDAAGAPLAGMVNLPNLSGVFGAVSGGAAEGSGFSFGDVGVIKLTAQLESADYLGAGNVSGAPLNVGRFVADHFETQASGPLPCASTGMVCPAGAPTMVYSRQEFELQVTAVNAAGATLLNYSGPFARAATLTAWNGAGSGATTQNPPATPAGALLAPATLAAASFGADPLLGPGVAKLKASYAFARAFDGAAPHATGLAAPTPVYLRAAESAGGDGATSSRGAASKEGGVTVASGRLNLGNAYGSELSPLRIALRAEYFTGYAANQGWRLHDGDGGAKASAVTAAGAVFGNCSKFLSVAGACKVGALAAAAAPATLPMAAGLATLQLRAPGVGGGAELRMGDPLWLPSTVARLVFGQYRSPLIYLRELH